MANEALAFYLWVSVVEHMEMGRHTQQHEEEKQIHRICSSSFVFCGCDWLRFLLFSQFLLERFVLALKAALCKKPPVGGSLLWSACVHFSCSQEWSFLQLATSRQRWHARRDHYPASLDSLSHKHSFMSSCECASGVGAVLCALVCAFCVLCVWRNRSALCFSFSHDNNHMGSNRAWEGFAQDCWWWTSTYCKN